MTRPLTCASSQIPMCKFAHPYVQSCNRLLQSCTSGSVFLLFSFLTYFSFLSMAYHLPPSRPGPNWWPYSAKRLTRMCRQWNMQSDAQELEDDDGTPAMFRACANVSQVLRTWREQHEAWEDSPHPPHQTPPAAPTILKPMPICRACAIKPKVVIVMVTRARIGSVSQLSFRALHARAFVMRNGQ